MSHKTDTNSRLIAVRWVTLAAFSFAVVSQVRVHLVARNGIIEQARLSKRFIIRTPEVARRGAIYTSDGRPLAQEDDSRVLVVDFRKVPRVSGFYMALGAATGIPASEFASLSQGSKKVVEWQKAFSMSQANSIQDVKRRWQADGVGLKPAGNRAYGLSLAAANVVGTVQERGPVLGVEQAFNRNLTGQNGETVGMVDRYGQYLPMRMGRETKPKQDGTAVTLTIDSELQRIAFEAVTQAVKANKADQGTVVVMVPGTGDILACASYPSFDPGKPLGKTKKGEFAPGHSTAFMSSLEPGSTFKILTAAKALDDGVVGAYENFTCTGSIRVGNRTIHCDAHGGNRAHGTLDPEQVIARSCNVISAQWAMRVGREPFLKYIEDLGLIGGSKLGLPGEGRGLLDKTDRAQKLQLANLGFGQSLNVTPIALASAFCVIGNHGLSVHPRLVDQIGENKQSIEPGKQILKPETAANVLQFMRSVIDSDRGTGKSLRIAGYDLGGKTGTAQRVGAGGYVSNFVGFVPALDPKAVILVMIDNPKGKAYYGAQVAGPVFLEVCKSVIKRMAIPSAAHLASKASGSRVALSSPRATKSSPVITTETAGAVEIEDSQISQGTTEEQTIASTGPEIEVSAREIPERGGTYVGKMTLDQIKKIAKPDPKRIAGVTEPTETVKVTRDVKRRKEPEAKPNEEQVKKSEPTPKRTETPSAKAKPKTEPKELNPNRSTIRPTRSVKKSVTKAEPVSVLSKSAKKTQPIDIVKPKLTRRTEPVSVVSTSARKAQPIATAKPKLTRRAEPTPKAEESKVTKPKATTKPKPKDRLKELELEIARLRKMIEAKKPTATKKPTSVTSKTAKAKPAKVIAKKSETPRKSSTSKPSSKKPK